MKLLITLATLFTCSLANANQSSWAKEQIEEDFQYYLENKEKWMSPEEIFSNHRNDQSNPELMWIKYENKTLSFLGNNLETEQKSRF